MAKRKNFTFYINGQGCFICTSHYRNPDGHVKFIKNRKTHYVHRLIYEECFGPIPEEHVIRHTCDNPACINPEHLKTGTNADNVRDRVERNRSAAGTKNGRAKLNEESVSEIRNSVLANSELARRYSVDRKLIRMIKAREIWKNAG